MPNPPKTADELRALVESHLLGMSAQEQKRFWLLITEHSSNEHHRKVCAFFLEQLQKIGDTAVTATNAFVEESNDLGAKLKKHRKPAKNTERDGEIMRLHAENKTAGQIVFALKDRFQLTDKSVNAVISREQRKQKNQE